MDYWSLCRSRKPYDADTNFPPSVHFRFSGEAKSSHLFACSWSWLYMASSTKYDFTVEPRVFWSRMGHIWKQVWNSSGVFEITLNWPKMVVKPREFDLNLKEWEFWKTQSVQTARLNLLYMQELIHVPFLLMQGNASCLHLAYYVNVYITFLLRSSQLPNILIANGKIMHL